MTLCLNTCLLQLEFGVKAYKGIDDFGSANTKIQLGNKPMFVFAGDKFEKEEEYKLAKSLLLDLFRRVGLNCLPAYSAGTSPRRLTVAEAVDHSISRFVSAGGRRSTG